MLKFIQDSKLINQMSQIFALFTIWNGEIQITSDDMGAMLIEDLNNIGKVLQQPPKN